MERKIGSKVLFPFLWKILGREKIEEKKHKEKEKIQKEREKYKEKRGKEEENDDGRQKMMLVTE